MSDKFIFTSALLVIYTLASCASTQTTTVDGARTGWAVAPIKFYDVCLPIHTQAASERKEADPEIVAHYICKIIEGLCTSNPTGSDCQKGQKEIREFLDKK